jgi:hypothetical protein
MTNSSQEVINMYDILNMSVEEICLDTSYEPAAVKSVLLSGSSKYRASLKKEREDITKEELSEAYEVVKQYMRCSENDKIRFKAALRVIDEAKGRLDKVEEVKNSKINILVFNQNILKAREAMEKGITTIDLENPKQALLENAV